MTDKDDKFILMNMDDTRSKKIAEVMGNETCKKIIDYLTYNPEKSEEDIAKALEMKLNTVEYNLKKLIESGLVEQTKNFFWSKRGKKIPLYKLAKKHIVISPRASRPNLTLLKTIIPVIIAVALVVALIAFSIPKNGVSTGNKEQIQGLQKFSSMEELKSFLKDNTEANSYGLYGRGIAEGVATFDTAVASAPEASMKASADSGAGSSGAQDYSETNIQVAGVDEPDIVKNDGKYIYVLSMNKVVILNAYPAEEMQILSEINITNPINIFINKDKLVVFSNEYSGREGSLISIYDISDRTDPELDQEVELDGYYVDARMIDNYVYLIANKYTNYNDVILPYVSVDGVKETMPVSDIYYFPTYDSSYIFTNILALNIADGSYETQTYLLGSSYTIYVSENNIYLTGTKTISSKDYFQDFLDEVVLSLLPSEEKSKVEAIMVSEDPFYIKQREVSEVLSDYSMKLVGKEKSSFDSELSDKMEEFNTKLQKKLSQTIIHKIEINKDQIEYIANGEVPGTVLNQFSMDEFNKDFRIATTTGNTWGNANSLNHLYVLDENLKIIGSLEDLAKGERIYSVRFMGEKAYVVTFRQVDPLFVIDLSDSTNPEVLGQLKITGYSSYLHPYDENHIIGIGKEATAEGRAQGLKIALFDVSDVENPIEQAKYEVKEQWSDSTALYDHKAFLFDKEKELLVLPVSYTKEIHKDYVEGQILVGFKEDVTREQAEELIDSYGLSYESIFTGPNAWIDPLLKSMKVYVPNGKEQEWIKLFEKEALVDYAELNVLLLTNSERYPPYEYWQGAFVFNINENEISLRGTVDHKENKSEEAYYYGPNAVERSLYMDNVLYTLSRSMIKANDLETVEEINKINLPYTERDYPIYGTTTGVAGSVVVEDSVVAPLKLEAIPIKL